MKIKIQTYIIDDEQDAVSFIESIIKEYCPPLEVIGKAHNVREGISLIHEKQPDWVVWDVEMPMCLYTKEIIQVEANRNYLRPHNSHLINLEHVKKYIRAAGGAIEMADGSQVPISRTRKDLFLTHMGRL